MTLPEPGTTDGPAGQHAAGLDEAIDPPLSMPPSSRWRERTPDGRGIPNCGNATIPESIDDICRFESRPRNSMACRDCKSGLLMASPRPDRSVPVVSASGHASR